MHIEELSQFEQFSQLSEEDRILLQSSLRIQECMKNDELIIPLGYREDLEFFLLEGGVKLISEDGREQTISAGAPEARFCLARLRPSLYEVRSKGYARLLLVPGSVLSEKVKIATASQKNMDALSPMAEKLYQRLSIALDAQTFKLPSIPDVALKVREILEQEEPEMEDLEAAINRDPSIAAKLVAAANSALYRRGQACSTTRDALRRLGLDTTSQLVMLFSLSQLFNAEHGWVKQRMTQTWTQGVRVAAIAQLLALNHKHLSSDEALLLGLIHNLGELAILKFIDQEEVIDSAQMETVLEELMPQAGALLLSHWNFDESFIQILANLNNWQEDTGGDQPTLGDLLRVARLHSLIGSPHQYRFPRMDEVPAFQKLIDQGLTPELSLQLVEDAADQVKEVHTLFGIG